VRATARCPVKGAVGRDGEFSGPEGIRGGEGGTPLSVHVCCWSGGFSSVVSEAGGMGCVDWRDCGDGAAFKGDVCVGFV